MSLRRYLATLSTGRTILWCYVLWYLVVLVKYFDPSARLWLTSLGLSVIIGFALYLSRTGSSAARANLDRWTLFRLFLMPFCVSSFAALVKGKNIILIFSPEPREDLLAAAVCLAFALVVFTLKRAGV